MIVVPEMPLYWRTKRVPGVVDDVLPPRAPFVFDYDPGLDLIIEQRSPRLSQLLRTLYQQNANVGYLQDGNSELESYGADFWRFLETVLADFPARTVLDVGCGGCVLLERLKRQGREVVGVDPSPVAVEAGRRKNIPVIPEFFPPKSLDYVPDLIFQVDVLEHVEDPVAFLRAEVDCLAEGGLVVVDVPDCTRSIERGDISMALHQHVNMFDGVSLPNTFRAAGLEVIRMERSRYGSALYCVGRKSNAPLPVARSPERWVQFETRARANIAAFQEHAGAAQRSGEAIGFFMPQRAFPYLGTMGWFEGFRVFDNMNVWHGRYLDGLDVKIENQADLVADPVDHVFVMSLTFGEEVATALLRDAPSMKVTTLAQMLPRLTV